LPDFSVIICDVIRSCVGRELLDLKQIYLHPDDYLVVKAGILYDGQGSPPRKKVLIHIWNGRVQIIEPDAGEIRPEHLTTTLPEPLVWGGEYCTVLPALVDCHVHLALDGEDFSGSLALWDGRPRGAGRVDRLLHTDLDFGIVAVRDGGDKAGIGLMMRDLTDDRGTWPRVRASGTALRKKGKYGSFLGPGLSGYELQSAVTKLAGRGVDQIKVLVSGVVSFREYGRVGELQFSLSELKEIVQVAAGYGLPVMAHASSDEAVQLALMAGVSSVEHGYFISEESLHALAEQSVPWIPTIVPVTNQLRGRMSRRYDQESRLIIERTYRRQLDMLAMAAELGVVLGVGTDAGAAGVLHGPGFWQELGLYSQAGLSREAIIAAATKNGSSILGLNEQLGSVTPGKPACLLLLDEDLDFNRGSPPDSIGLICPVLPDAS
jgi:imidazolonepropionase-like amidohydrolase